MSDTWIRKTHSYRFNSNRAAHYCMRHADRQNCPLPLHCLSVNLLNWGFSVPVWRSLLSRTFCWCICLYSLHVPSSPPYPTWDSLSTFLLHFQEPYCNVYQKLSLWPIACDCFCNWWAPGCSPLRSATRWTEVRSRTPFPHLCQPWLNKKILLRPLLYTEVALHWRSEERRVEEWSRLGRLDWSRDSWAGSLIKVVPLPHSLTHSCAHSFTSASPRCPEFWISCTTAPLTLSHTHTHASLTPETTPLSSLLLLPFRSVAPLLHQQFFYHLHLFFSLFLLPFFLFFLLFFCAFFIGCWVEIFHRAGRATSVANNKQQEHQINPQQVPKLKLAFDPPSWVIRVHQIGRLRQLRFILSQSL